MGEGRTGQLVRMKYENKIMITRPPSIDSFNVWSCYLAFYFLKYFGAPSPDDTNAPSLSGQPTLRFAHAPFWILYEIVILRQHSWSLYCEWEIIFDWGDLFWSHGDLHQHTLETMVAFGSCCERNHFGFVERGTFGRSPTLFDTSGKHPVTMITSFSIFLLKTLEKSSGRYSRIHYLNRLCKRAVRSIYKDEKNPIPAYCRSTHNNRQYIVISYYKI